MACSRTGVGYIPNEPGTPCARRKSVLKENLKDECMSKKHRRQMSEIPMAKARNNLSHEVSTVEPHQMIRN